MTNRIHCIPIFALPAMAQFAEVDRDAIGVERFRFQYDHSSLIHNFPNPDVTRKRADGSEVTKKRVIPTNIAEAVELAQELLRL